MKEKQNIGCVDCQWYQHQCGIEETSTRSEEARDETADESRQHRDDRAFKQNNWRAAPERPLAMDEFESVRRDEHDDRVAKYK